MAKSTLEVGLIDLAVYFSKLRSFFELPATGKTLIVHAHETGVYLRLFQLRLMLKNVERREGDREMDGGSGCGE